MEKVRSLQQLVNSELASTTLLQLSLRQQDRRASRLPPLEPAVRLRRLGKRYAGMYWNFHCAAQNDAEELFAHGENVRAPREMHWQQRPGGEERAFVRQEHDVERLDRARRRAEADEIAKGLRQSSEAGKVALPTPS